MNILLENNKMQHYLNMAINILIILDVIQIAYLLLSVNISSTLKIIFFTFDVIVCVFLLIDFFTNMHKADKKSEFVRHNILYLIASIPLELVLPVYFMSFRFILFIKLLKSYFFKKYFEEIHRFLENTKFDKLLTWIIFTVIIFTFALFFIDPSLGLFDSLWFVVVTLTTVGYGDVTPGSFHAKIISIMLLVMGVFIFSTLTGAISSYFNDKILNIDTDVEDDMEIVFKKLDDMSVELESIKEELELARSQNRELHEKLDEILKK